MYTLTGCTRWDQTQTMLPQIALRREKQLPFVSPDVVCTHRTSSGGGASSPQTRGFMGLYVGVGGIHCDTTSSELPPLLPVSTFEHNHSGFNDLI